MDHDGSSPVQDPMDLLERAKAEFPGTTVIRQGNFFKIRGTGYELFIDGHALAYRRPCVAKMMARPVSMEHGHGLVREMVDRVMSRVLAIQHVGSYGPCVVEEYDHNGEFVGSRTERVCP